MLFESPANAAAKLFPAFNIPPPVRISSAGDAAAAGLLGLEHVAAVHAAHAQAQAHGAPGDMHAHAAHAHAAHQALVAQAAVHAAHAQQQAQQQAQHQQQQQQQNMQPAQMQTNGGSHAGSSGRSTPVLTPAAPISAASDPSPGKLFVGGLSWQTSSEKLREYFGMFGAVTDVLIMKDPITQRSRGFGFITFAEPASVDKVLKVPIHTLDGKKIDPKHATPKNRPKAPNKTKKIFVGGVSQDTSADEVKAYFAQFGKVEETVMLMDQATKRHRGFGFVTFDTEESVDRVCDIHFHTVKNKKVECKRAQPKEAVIAPQLTLGKRLVLAGGIRAPGVGVGVGVPTQLLPSAQTPGACGRLVYPTLSYRYSPYALPAPPAAAAPQLPPAPTPFQAYQLAGVDMSSFQNVDWGAMYGMGMYV